MAESIAPGDDEAPEFFPRAFGPYTLLGSLGRGGMGEVFVASREGIAGIARRCVVKTLRPGFSDDPEYVARFLDEARIVVQLHHRNICPVFDVGKVGVRHFLAMEYIAGRDLRTVGLRAEAAQSAKGSAIESGLALLIVSEVLEALAYAHRLVDTQTGAPLQLVHRDVSPHNVMLGFEGDIRLIDFGLAASTLKIEQTAPNVVMGKVAYMAPEHVCGERLDARADQFSAAVMAYELFVGERFYEERGARETYALASQGGFRPHKFDALPDELRKCLDRALQTDRLARYDSCSEMRDAIETFRYRSGMRGDAPALRALMQTVFAHEIDDERQMLTRLGSASVPVATPPPEMTKSESSSSKKKTVGHGFDTDDDPATVSTASHPRAVAVRGIALDTTVPVRRSSGTLEVARPRRGTRLVAAALVFACAAVSVGLAVRNRAPSTTPAPAPPLAVALPLPAATPTSPATGPTSAAAALPAETAPALPVVDAKPTPTTETPVATDAAVPVRPHHARETHPTTTADPLPVPPPVEPHSASLRPAPPSSALTSASIHYVMTWCPQLACAAPLTQHASDWANLGADLPAFKLGLHDCVESCAAH